MTDTELRIQLRQLLVNRFDDGELRTLCFDLGVGYDNLPGSGKADKARELVSYMERREGLAELVRVGRHARPDAPWPENETDQPKSETGQSAGRPAIAAGRDVNNSGTMILGNIQGNVTIGRTAGNR